MHSTSLTDNKSIVSGSLYIVATPIGNKDDITLRALKILENVNLIAAEDTRHSVKLLEMHSIKNRLVSIHEHNEVRMIPKIIKKLKSGETVALISDAGTPLISDPGYRLVKAASKEDINVVPIPGVSACVAAVSVSGLPTDIFTFAGFPPKKSGKRRSLLKKLMTSPGSLVFYESPRRVLKFLQDILEIIGDCNAMLSREMTKKHEEFLRGTVSELIELISDRIEIKGECTLVIDGSNLNITYSPTTEEIENAILELLQTSTKKPTEMAKLISTNYGISKNTAYELIIKMKSTKKLKNNIN